MLQKAFFNDSHRLRAGWRFLIAVFVLIIVQYVAVIITNLVIARSANTLLFESIFRPLALVMLLTAFAAMVKGLDLSPQGPLEGQGLQRNSSWLRELSLGMAVGAVMIMLAVGIIVALGGYHLESISWSLERLLVIIWVTMTAAALEEVGFRGYPFQKLVEGIGPSGAIAVLSALFGVIHLGNPHGNAFGFVNTTLVGALLAIAYLRTRALWLPIGIHFAWNFSLGTVFGLPVSGVDLFSVILKAQASGPEWLTGGDYGIEASVTGAVAILAGIGGVYLSTRPKKVTGSGTPPAI
jgi:uncharacterized protein